MERKYTHSNVHLHTTPAEMSVSKNGILKISSRVIDLTVYRYVRSFPSRPKYLHLHVVRPDCNTRLEYSYQLVVQRSGWRVSQLHFLFRVFT